MQKGTVMLAAAVMYTVPYESCPLSPQWSILWDCCIPIWPLSSIVRSSQPHYSLGFTSLYSLLRVMEHLSPPPPHPAALHTHHLALSLSCYCALSGSPRGTGVRAGMRLLHCSCSAGLSGGLGGERPKAVMVRTRYQGLGKG